jgi:hypothetical protein
LLDTVLTERNFHDAHRFVWDRTRSIRTDFSYYSRSEWDIGELRLAVYCYERIAGFHLMALHYFSHHPEERPDSFSKVQEVEQLVATLVTLKDMYEDCISRSLYIPSISYFFALWGILFGHQGNVSEQLAAYAVSRMEDAHVVHLAGIFNQVMHNLVSTQGNTVGPRAVLQDSICAMISAELSSGNVPVVMTLFVEYHFNYIRENGLSHLRDAIVTNRMTKKDATPSFLAQFLCFDDLSEMGRWLEQVSPPLIWRHNAGDLDRWAEFNYNAPITGTLPDIRVRGLLLTLIFQSTIAWLRYPIWPCWQISPRIFPAASSWGSSLNVSNKNFVGSIPFTPVCSIR